MRQFLVCGSMQQHGTCCLCICQFCMASFSIAQQQHPQVRCCDAGWPVCMLCACHQCTKLQTLSSQQLCLPQACLPTGELLVQVAKLNSMFTGSGSVSILSKADAASRSQQKQQRRADGSSGAKGHLANSCQGVLGSPDSTVQVWIINWV